MRLALLLLLLASPSVAQDEYGSRGLFPVYQSGNQWIVFDKPRKSGKNADLMAGAKFLIVGSLGADLFVVGRTSATYGGLCRNKKPLKLRAALLKGESHVFPAALDRGPVVKLVAHSHLLSTRTDGIDRLRCSPGPVVL